MTMLSAKINEKLSEYKKTAPLFLNASLSFFLLIFICYDFVETLFNINLCTHVTKYTVILNFDFSLTIYPHIMPMIKKNKKKYFGFVPLSVDFFFRQTHYLIGIIMICMLIGRKIFPDQTYVLCTRSKKSMCFDQVIKVCKAISYKSFRK